MLSSFQNYIVDVYIDDDNNDDDENNDNDDDNGDGNVDICDKIY